MGDDSEFVSSFLNTVYCEIGMMFQRLKIDDKVAGDGSYFKW